MREAGGLRARSHVVFACGGGSATRRSAAGAVDPQLARLLEWWIDLFTVLGQEDDIRRTTEFEALLLESLPAQRCGSLSLSLSLFVGKGTDRARPAAG